MNCSNAKGCPSPLTYPAPDTNALLVADVIDYISTWQKLKFLESVNPVIYRLSAIMGGWDNVDPTTTKKLIEAIRLGGSPLAEAESLKNENGIPVATYQTPIGRLPPNP